MDYDHISKNLTQFKQLVESPNNLKLDQVKQLLSQLKIGLVVHLSKPGPNDNQPNEKLKRDLTLGREILESLALYSIKIGDINSFEKYFAQLKPYYYDYTKFLEPSVLENTLIGLNLMRLLSVHKTSEFHSELELLSLERLENSFIKFPLLIEKSITEGSYNKVIQSRSGVPSEYYHIFIDTLSEAIKEDIANCSEKSFKSLSLADAEKVLLFNNNNQFTEYIKKREWTVEGNRIVFANNNASNVEIPALQLIHQTLNYAKELERIV
eukprot:gene5035-6265_t